MARVIRSVVLVAFVALAARGESTLWTEASSGEPGEIVTVIIYATTEVSVRAADVMFAFDTGAFTYLDTDFTTSALAGAAMDLGQIDWSAVGAIDVVSTIYFDQGTPFPPTEAWEYARIRLRIRSGVAAGEYPAGVVKSVPEKPAVTCLVTTGAASCAPVAIVPGSVSVRAATRPSPPDALACRQDLEQVRLSWRNPTVYDRVTVLRDGALLATLGGDAETYTDPNPPLGERAYGLTGVVGPDATITVACTVDVGPPVVDGVQDLNCTAGAAGAALSWKLPRDYTAIEIVRNGEPLAMLPGVATSYADREIPPGAVYYEVLGHVEGLVSAPRACVVHGTYVLRLGSVRVAPGSTTAEVPVLLSSPVKWSAFSFGIEHDVQAAQLAGATAVGTVLESYWPFFLVARTLEGGQGSIVAVEVYDATGVHYLPPAVETCALVLEFSVQGPAGSVIPLRFSKDIGSPPVEVGIVYDVGMGAQWMVCERIDGEIIIGDPLLPEVRDLKLANAKGDGVLLSWRNAAAYDTIEVERNGTVIQTLAGAARSTTDALPGPGAYWYRVRGTAGGTVSPWSMVIHTALSGAALFRRGDTNLDAMVDVADAVTLCEHLFRGRPAECRDAFDANDDGRLNIADPVYLLAYLFAGRLAPPTPGPALRWYDPTPDELDCVADTP